MSLTEPRHANECVVPAILRRESTPPLLDARWKIAGMTGVGYGTVVHRGVSLSLDARPEEGDYDQ